MRRRDLERSISRHARTDQREAAALLMGRNSAEYAEKIRNGNDNRDGGPVRRR
jgi:hypothetical protein